MSGQCIRARLFHCTPFGLLKAICEESRNNQEGAARHVKTLFPSGETKRGVLAPLAKNASC